MISVSAVVHLMFGRYGLDISVIVPIVRVGSHAVRNSRSGFRHGGEMCCFGMRYFRRVDDSPVVADGRRWSMVLIMRRHSQSCGSGGDQEDLRT